MLSIIGMIFKSKISKRFQDIIMQVMGLAVMFIGASGALRGIFTVKDGFLETGGTMLMIASLTIGALLGELINIEAQMERFGEWLKEKAKSSGDTKFVEGFVTASLTVCIGAMAIVGSIEDGISGNHDTLFAKAVLDLVIVMVCVAFSAIPVAILQGTVTICAGFIAPIMNDSIIANISFIGSMLIFCVGVNLSFGKKFKVGNMLPAIIIPFIYGLIAG
ncbi:MAG: DUF554 domain-containing protein [Oscillospiraceae bacterium]